MLPCGLGNCCEILLITELFAYWSVWYVCIAVYCNSGIFTLWVCVTIILNFVSSRYDGLLALFVLYDLLGFCIWVLI